MQGRALHWGWGSWFNPLGFFFSSSCAISMVSWHWLLLQARFFFQQLISGVSYCHAMVFELFFFLKKKKSWKFVFLYSTNSNYIIYLTFLYSFDEANMSPGLEVGKYFVGWKPSSSFEDMWFWVLQGTNCLHIPAPVGIISVLISWNWAFQGWDENFLISITWSQVFLLICELLL